MMDEKRLNEILTKFGGLNILVFGDFYLDHYLMLNRDLSETSVETGLESFQVTEIRNSPGVTGVVVNNLAALGVPMSVLALIGKDGSGFDLKQELRKRGVDTRHIIESESIMTPVYMKPMLSGMNEPIHELNRMDIKNRGPLAPDLQEALCHELKTLFPKVDGMVIIDQTAAQDDGVFPKKVLDLIGDLAVQYPDKPILVDSRDRINAFKKVIIKCNDHEALRNTEENNVEAAAVKMSLINPRGAFVTAGPKGMLACQDGHALLVPGVKVEGMIDIVGAGDSAATGIISALCAGASFAEAALIGNLVASITIRQLGTTGTATVEQVKAAFSDWKKCN